MEKISLKELSQQLSKRWMIILICVLFSLIIGLTIYKTTPNEYSSSVQFMLVSGDGETSQSRLGSLASIAGININSPSVGIPPSAYEFILASSSFLIDVVYEDIEFEGDSVKIGNYLTQRMITGWNNKIRSLSNDKKPKVIREDLGDPEEVKRSISNSLENLQIMELKGNVSTSVNLLRNSIEYSKMDNKPMMISVNLQDPEASAMVAKVIIEKLESYINRYTQNNKENNSDFLKSEVKKAQQSLYEAQNALAAAKDRNMNANRAIANLEINRLSLRNDQAQRTYNELALQLENSKIQEEKNNPLFIILEPPSVLSLDKPTAPRLVIYIALSIVTGLFIALTVIFGISFLKRNF